MRKKKAKQSAPAAAPAAAEKEAVAQEASPSPAPSSPAAIQVPDVPSVWREAGYLVLVYAVRAGEVYYISCNDGARSASFPRFYARMTRQMLEVNPHHLILNLLVRLRTGTFDMRVREERKLTAMLNKDELLKLSERELGRAYAEVMGVSGPQRIKAEHREKYIGEMISKLRADADKPKEDEIDSSTGVGELSDKLTKRPKKTKTAAGTKKAAKAPKEPKAAKTPKEPKEPKAAKAPREPKAPRVKDPNNPFRTGTMKHAGYENFKKVSGDRKAVVAFLVDNGAKPSTASSWFNQFVATGKPKK